MFPRFEGHGLHDESAGKAIAQEPYQEHKTYNPKFLETHTRNVLMGDLGYLSRHILDARHPAQVFCSHQ